MTEFSLISNFLTMLIEIVGVLFLFHGLEKKEEKRQAMLGYFFLFALLTLIYIPIIPAMNASRVYSAANLRNQVLRTTINWAAIFSFLSFTKEKKKLICAYFAALYVLLYMVSFNMREALRPFINGLNSATQEVAMLILLATIQWGCVYSTYRILKLDKIRSISLSRWPVVIIPILVELYFKWSLISPGEETVSRPIDMIIYSVCGTLGLLALVILFENNFAAQERRAALQMEQVQLQYEMQNAKRAMQTNTDIRRLYHDMKNHLLALQSMVENSAEAEEYLEGLCSQFSEYESSVNTGSSVVDALLSEKMERSRLDGIRFNICADLTSLGFVNSIDLVTIFGNAVDNAIEALQMLPEGQERILYIKTTEYANMSVLRFSNQYCGKLELQEGKLLTGKTDRELHGIGLNSIRKTVKRYNGNVETQFDNEDGWFRLIIMIPNQKYVSAAKF